MHARTRTAHAHTTHDTLTQVTTDSLALHAIARRLRARRFAGGALRLDNTRLYFTLDAGGQPVAAAPYVQQVRFAILLCSEECNLLASIPAPCAIAFSSLHSELYLKLYLNCRRPTSWWRSTCCSPTCVWPRSSATLSGTTQC